VRVDLTGQTLAADVYRVTVAGEGAGGALDFDGIDDFVRVPASAAFAPGTGDWTAECWVALDDVARQNIAITCADGDFANGWRLIEEPGAPINSRLYFVAAGPGGSGEVSTAVGGAVPQLGTWYHVVGVYDSAAGEARLYINGVHVGTSATGLSLPVTPSADMLFSRYDQTSAGQSHYLFGQMDEVRVWNIARTGTEIARDMYRHLVGNESGLVGYWSFDNLGQVVLDSSPAAHNGTLGTDDLPAADDPARSPSSAWPALADNVGDPLEEGSDYVFTFSVQ